MQPRSARVLVDREDAFNPTRRHLLARFGLDPELVWASGHHVEDASGRRYLDFLSQYGVLSLGHNHPELCEEIASTLSARQIVMSQPYPPTAAIELGERLAELAPGDLFHSIFTNSGAEAVEAAIKLARVRTGRRGILSTTGAFHGKTLGALSATGRAEYARPFGLPLPGFDRVPFGDLEALERTLDARGESIAAFLVEPIQGEGGVRIPPPGYLVEAADLCREHGVLFVLDEIQTGLGRTGTLFGARDVEPDVLLLAKALGGGLLPLGAVLTTPEAWDHEFGLLHSSTFANNNLAARVGIRTLDILTRDDERLVRHVADRGVDLLAGLRRLQSRYPGVIEDVRGEGYLAAIEFRPIEGRQSHTLAYFSDGGFLVAALSAYLLRVHGLLTAPVFNDDQVLRLEPPFTVGRAEIDQALASLDTLCDALDRLDVRQLVDHLIGGTGRTEGERFAARPARPAVAPSERRFAFVVHPTDDDAFIQNDPSLARFSTEERTRWADRSDPGEGRIVDSIDGLRSATGDEVGGIVIVLPIRPRTLLSLGRRQVLPLFEDALELAAESGARIASLGAFVSILSDGGRLLRGKGIGVSSGNSLTAVASVDGVLETATRLGRDPSTLRTAVVGATGSVGRLIALLLADRVASLDLVGNQESFDSPDRLAEIAGEARTRAEIPIEIGRPLETAVAEADLVLVATSTPSELISSGLPGRGSIVCDVARPGNVAPGIADRPDVFFFEGGLVRWPEPVAFGPRIPGAPAGVNVACFTEAVVLALAGRFDDASIGRRIPLEEALEIGRLARHHGFTPAPPIAFGHLLGPEAEQRFLETAGIDRPGDRR